MDAVGLAHLHAQRGAIIAAVFLSVIAMTYLVTWFFALFHPDARRRAEARKLLLGHPLHRGTSPDTPTVNNDAMNDDTVNGDRDQDPDSS